MTWDFEYHNPVHVIFGVKSVEKVGEVSSNIGRKPLVVHGKTIEKLGILDKLIDPLEERGIDFVTYSEVSPNPKVEDADKGVMKARVSGCDHVIAIGGGSSIDAGKAIAVGAVKGKSISDFLHHRLKVDSALPVIAVPTTAGTGTEVDRFSVIIDTEDKSKRAIASSHIYPRYAIVDPELTITMPPRLTAASGFDAFTHAWESYVSQLSNPLSEAYSEKAVKLIGESLEKAVKNPDDIGARSKMAMAAMLSGYAIDIARVGLCHAIEHPLSARLGIHHGEGLAAIAPAVIEFSYSGAEDKFDRLAGLLSGVPGGKDRVVESIYKFREKIGLDSTLTDLGVRRDMIPLLAEDTLRYMRYAVNNNPVKASKKDIETIIEKSL